MRALGDNRLNNPTGVLTDVVDGEAPYSDENSVTCQLIDCATNEYLRHSKMLMGKQGDWQLHNATKYAVLCLRPAALQALIYSEPAGFSELVDPNNARSLVEPYELSIPTRRLRW